MFDSDTHTFPGLGILSVLGRDINFTVWHSLCDIAVETVSSESVM